MTQVLKSLWGHRCGGKIGQSVQLSAKWLFSFHEHLPSTAMPVKAAWPVIEHICPWAAGCHLADELLALLPSEIPAKICCLREKIRASHSVCRIGAIHREFGPSNILVGHEGVTGLDAGCNESGPQLFDVAAFAAYLRILPFISPRTERLCESLESIFLSTYFKFTQVPNSSLFSLLVIGGILRNMDRHVRMSATFPRALTSIARVYLLRNYSRILLTALMPD